MQSVNPQAEMGCEVVFRHRLSRADGVVFEDALHDEPMRVRLGEGALAQGIEYALLGMRAGQSQTLRIGPDLAFGEHRDDCERDIPRSAFPPDCPPAPGRCIEFETDDGTSVPGTVLADYVQVDFNHPLAGCEVILDLEVIEVIPPEEPR